MTRKKSGMAGTQGTPRQPANGWLPALAILIAACVLSTAEAHAQTSTFPDIQSILERKTLRVGLIAHDIPPFVMTADDGTLGGVDLRIARGIARRLGVEADIVRTAGTTDALVRQAAAGEVDIAISFITRTIDRAMQVRFSRPYVTENIGFALNRRAAIQAGADCPESPDDLVTLSGRDWKIGALRGTVSQKALEDRGLEGSASLFDSLDDMLAGVESGGLLGGLAGEVALRFALNAQPRLRIKVKLCLVGDQKDHIAIAIRPDAPNLKDLIDIALENVDLRLDGSGVMEVDADWEF